MCAAACTKQKESTPNAPVMRIGIGTPKGTPNTGSRALVSLLKADTWLAIKPDGHVDKRIATEWQWDTSGTVLRLKLKPGVYFHDGTLLTAQLAADVLRTTDTTFDNLSLKSVASFESEGSDTVVLRLKERNAFVLADLGGIPVVMPGKADIGTGAYQIVKRKGRAPSRLSPLLSGPALARRRGRRELSDAAQRVVALMRGESTCCTK